ncbi:C-terminal processing peptidase-3. Serine peptidase. MEROPS family S41A [Natronincola peptidivorans]|uniref:C-terminal processing peptidase-3. Serine peptidase. MEROPS family S41A n=1 Tax=Natronincola peptidivorans TaxID=426128 RepID=A0A1I0BE13_9FIRM|nr:S41 family peptidase [Natronincola peptidivorans]SET05193.1 C-terminal processing peptidase-3. Serine peptidase. MEROPS family S41A [Natronincola peptidivorans]
MISKKKAVIGAIILILLTTVLNLTLGNSIALVLGQKVIISKDTYQYYQTLGDEYGKLFTLKDFLIKNYYKELDEEKLMESAIKGMFQGVEDPYTSYMTENEFTELMTRTQGTYGGIGVIITPGEDGLVTVVSPIEDTPGERAGIATGDKVLAVDGKAVSGEQLELAADMMRGEPGTEVVLSIWREGTTEPFDVSIEREVIRLQTVRSEVLENHIGYVRISMFDEQTYNDFEIHMNDLQNQNIQGLIIDLRNNPGGLLTQCLEIADMILPEQVIVYTEDRHGAREVEKSNKKQIDLPIVVLVNKGSASASEILAGAIQDGNRGTIIGTTTFGKGLVQQVKPLNDGTGFKYTVSQYFTPSGSNIHGTGIDPDIIVELPEELRNEINLEADQDIQLKKAIEVINEKVIQGNN